MKEHLKNVHQEVDHTNNLVASKNKEIQSEEHLQALAARELGRYQTEIKAVIAQKEVEKEQLTMVQNQIFKANEEMDSYKLAMNWNQEELEQWAMAARQKEEDNLALQKYTRADEIKIKDLTLQIEKLTAVKVEKTTLLENEATETQSRQIELDRTAEAFKELHAERQNLVKQWQEAIETMKRRDVEINEIAEQFADARKIREAKFEVLDENRERLRMQETDNAEVQAKIEQSERIVQMKRGTEMELKDTQQNYKDELEVVKNELASSAASLLKKRQENVVAESELQERKVYLETQREKYQAMKKKVDAEVSKTDQGERSAKDAEVAVADREKEVVAAEKVITTLKEKMFRSSQQLFAMRQEEANLISEISGSQAASKNLSTKLHSFDAESMRQQELIYNAEFQIQQMERKVARGLGERSDEEKRQLMGVIKELEQTLQARVDKRKMLAQQCKKLNNEYRASIKKKEFSEEQQVELKGKIAEVELENSSCELQLKELVQSKEEMMVQNDVMRLEVKRLRDTLNSKADEVFNLENRRQQLKLSMEERKEEIAVHSEVRRAQIRAAEDEKHKNSVELGKRRSVVEKLKSKYESTIAKPEGGEEMSQAALVIMAAQKREELQREGDELDHEIRRREKEMRALEHTLEHLNVRNTQFRLSFHKADMGSHEADELKQLQDQAKMGSDALFRKKKELQRLQTDYEEDMRRLEQVNMQASRLDEQNTHLVNAQVQVESELVSQQDALQKANDRLDKLRVRHRENFVDPNMVGDEETLQEKLFKAESYEQNTAAVLQTLGQLSNEFPEIYDVLMTTLGKNGLQIPSGRITAGEQ
jgi:chromosome segregation ATPase